MKLETRFEPAGLAEVRAAPWAPWVAAGLAFAVILAVYWRTAADMVVIWNRSETFTHGFLVLPISLWLVWQKRAALRDVKAGPWMPALLAVAAAGVLWLLSDLASVASPAQLALVLMLQFATLAVLGPRVGNVILFPLAFLLFAVPMGEFLVPKLMDTTADFTVLALQATGVPVHREGNYFVIPTGSWSVIEGCSGIRYLIASMMAGSLFAYLTYQSAWRRAGFFAVSIVVPIVANWLRAYLIVMVGHLSSNKYAAGVDHLIYGWIFFGVVIAIMFWIGSWWREDARPSTTGAASATGWTAERLPRRVPVSFTLAAASAIVVAGAWLPVGYWIEASTNPAPPKALVVEPEHGWRADAAKGFTWKPAFHGQRSEYQGLFTKDGHQVGIYIAYYSQQTQDRELVNQDNVLVRTTDPQWRQVSAGTGVLEWTGEQVTAQRVELRGPGARLAVAKLYWIGGWHTSSDHLAKVLLAIQRLTFRDDDSAAVILYTSQNDSPQTAGDALARFAKDMSGAVDRALEQAARR